MRKKTIKTFAWMIVFLTLLTAGGQVRAWHGAGGPTGSGTAFLGPTPFSNPLFPLLTPQGYRTCLIGNFGGIDPNFVPPPPPNPIPPNSGHAREHHWKFLSRTGGLVTLLITASSVSASDAGGQIVATATHDPLPSTTTVTAVHSGIPGPMGDVSATMIVPTIPGVAYDLSISSLSGYSSPSGHHYKVGVLGPNANMVELGYAKPTLEYHEGGPERWAVNAALGEAVTAQISVDPTATFPPPLEVPPQATSVTYSVVDPFIGFPPIAGPMTSPISSASPIFIGFTNNAGGIKSFVLEVNGNSHYKLNKTPGPDEGVYALNCKGEQGIAGIDIKPGSFPNSINLGKKGTVSAAILSSQLFDAASVNPATVTLAGAGVKVKGNGTLMAGQEDVNEDSFLDLVVHFEAGDLELTDGEGIAILQGFTFTGLPIVGADSVRVMH